MRKIINNTSKYTVTINNFEGPLDLLCYLIDKKKMSILDISLTELTDAYLEYLKEMEDLNLEIASEFLIMASTLLYIKSKKLLPETEEVEEEEESEEDILNRITEYKKYKEVTKILTEMYRENSGSLIKPTENLELPHEKADVEFTLEDLKESYLNILNRNKKKINNSSTNVEKLAVLEKYTVRSKVKEMIDVLFKKTSFVFNKMFNVKEKNQVEIVTAFLGMLELAKLKKVSIKQEGIFEDISVNKISDATLDLSLIEE